MIAVILAGGYGLRLKVLTERKPKALLCFKGKSLIEHLLDNLALTQKISKIVIAVNELHSCMFEEALRDRGEDIIFYSDMSRTKEQQPSILKTILTILTKYQINEDVLMMGSDNYLEFPLTDFIEFQRQYQQSTLMYYHETVLENLSKTGVIKIDDNNNVLTMVEKSPVFISNKAVPPFYIFHQKDLAILHMILNKEQKSDHLGYMIERLSKVVQMKAYLMPNKRYDVGDLGSYIKAYYSI